MERKQYDQDGLAQLFVDPVLYDKIGTVEARLAKPNEEIATVIGGRIETINTAQDGDVVIRGAVGELYIMSGEKLTERYSGPAAISAYQTYEATGSTYAVEWDNGPAVFEPSWGGEMIIDDGDYLCSTTEKPNGDLYRIERSAFGETYREAQ